MLQSLMLIENVKWNWNRKFTLCTDKVYALKVIKQPYDTIIFLNAFLIKQ